MATNFQTRTLSAIVYAILVFGSLIINKYLMVAFLVMVCSFCVYEYTLITKSKLIYSISSLLILLGIFYLETESNHYPLISSILLFSSFLYCLFMLFRLFWNDVGRIHTEQKVVTSLFYLLIPFFLLIWIILNSDHVYHLLLPYFIFVWSSDVGAYLIGRRIGKTKLFEAISPNKTWEGFFGGGLFVMVGAILFYAFSTTSYSLIFWGSFGLTIWIFASLGDLIESQFKRFFQIKDSSQLIPGHGGFLDRFDGFLFAIPFFLLLLFIFDLI